MSPPIAITSEVTERVNLFWTLFFKISYFWRAPVAA